MAADQRGISTSPRLGRKRRNIVRALDDTTILNEWLCSFEIDPPMTHKVALAGHPGPQMEQALSHLKVSELIVGGSCHTLKQWATEWAGRHDVPLSIFWPDRTRHGKNAGKQMNKKIVWYADCLLVVWDCHPGHATHLIQQAAKSRLDITFVVTSRKQVRTSLVK